MSVFGVDIVDMNYQDAITLVGCKRSSDAQIKLAFCNANTANIHCKNAAFRDALTRFLVFPDGVGIDLAAHYLHGHAFKSNLHGTDFVPRLLQQTERRLVIRLIGAKPGIAERAAKALAAQSPHHDIQALSDGYLDQARTKSVLDGLRATCPDVLLVAMGNPAQELWIDAHITPDHAHVAIGVGALFDFLAGEVARAPLLFQRLRIEWLFRLAQEPRRLYRRYLVGNPLFLWRVVRHGRHWRQRQDGRQGRHR